MSKLEPPIDPPEGELDGHCDSCDKDVNGNCEWEDCDECGGEGTNNNGGPCPECGGTPERDVEGCAQDQHDRAESDHWDRKMDEARDESLGH
jgi:hypothetical protein